MTRNRARFPPDVAAAPAKASNKGYRYAVTLPSLRVNPGLVWYHGDDAALGRAAFTLDLDLGARVSWTRDRQLERYWDVLFVYPVVGYSFARHRGGVNGHRWSVGAGVGMGLLYQVLLSGRYSVGRLGDAWRHGARVDVELSAFHALGTSLGYTALLGDRTRHGVRWLVTLDVGTVIALALMPRSHH